MRKNHKLFGCPVSKEFFDKFQDYVKFKSDIYYYASLSDISFKEVIYFAIRKMIDEDNYIYSELDEESRDCEKFLGGKFPIKFINEFEKYFNSKKKEAIEIGHKLKVKRKWLLMFALNQVIDNDLFKR